MNAPPPLPGDVSRVAIVRRLDQEPKTYDRVWEPYLALGRRDIVVGYGRKLVQKSDMGDLLCSHSDDGGKTWSEPVMVFDSSVPIGGRRYAYANAILFRPRGQDTIWFFGQRCPLHYSDSEDAELCAAYSVDDGLSWQQVDLAMSFHSAMIVVAGVMELGEGGHSRYLLPAHRNTLRHDPHGDCRQFVLESTDLLHWELAGYIPQDEHPQTVFLHEGNIAWGDAPGELKIVMRTARWNSRLALDPPTAYSSVSRDGGRTWSLARAEPRLHNAISKGYYGTVAGGRHIYVYSDGPAGERKVLKYTVQSPSGEWSPPRVFFDEGVHNSYPTLVEESPGNFVCVWDSSSDAEHQRTLIRFGRLHVP